jgi:hypothetical protein
VLVDDFPTRPFTTSIARELGFSEKQLGVAVGRGILRRVLRGVYLRADLPDTVETRAACASLVITPGSVLRDRTAAWVHGVDVLTLAEHEVLPPIGPVSAGSGRRRTGSAWTAARATLPPRTS